MEGLTIKVEEVSDVDKSTIEQVLNLMDDWSFVSIRITENFKANISIEGREE